MFQNLILRKVHILFYLAYFASKFLKLLKRTIYKKFIGIKNEELYAELDFNEKNCKRSPKKVINKKVEKNRVFRLSLLTVKVFFY